MFPSKITALTRKSNLPFEKNIHKSINKQFSSSKITAHNILMDYTKKPFEKEIKIKKQTNGF